MPLFRPLRSIVLVAAAVAVLAEIVLGWLEHLPAWAIYPIALATGGIVIWMVLALDILARRGARPDRTDIAEMRVAQGGNESTLRHHDERLARAEAHLQLLAAEPDLASAERALGHASARVETWETLADDVPVWNNAVERWSALVEPLATGIAPGTTPANEHETHAARAALPPAGNFSSGDLRLAITYLVQRDRVVAAHDRLSAYRSSFRSAPA